MPCQGSYALLTCLNYMRHCPSRSVSLIGSINVFPMRHCMMLTEIWDSLCVQIRFHEQNEALGYMSRWNWNGWQL